MEKDTAGGSGAVFPLQNQVDVGRHSGGRASSCGPLKVIVKETLQPVTEGDIPGACCSPSVIFLCVLQPGSRAPRSTPSLLLEAEAWHLPEILGQAVLPLGS